MHLRHEYEIGKVIAKEHNCRHYRGINKKTKREVVIKSIPKKRLFDNWQRLTSLIAQIQTLKEIKSENVIELLDVYEAEKYVHLVMEHIKGENLLDLVKNKANYNEEDAKMIIKQLLKIVKKFHDKQIVHRDIKPDNIIIS